MGIRIQTGDITKVHADVIVNAANPVMLGGGGVDGAIHKIAGTDLRDLCWHVHADEEGVRCPVGSVRPTPAGDLPAKWVFHTVAPIKELRRESGELRVGEQRVKEAADRVKASLDMRGILKKIAILALGMDLKTIAIPALGCGVYGWTHEEVADIAMRWARDFRDWPLEITFCLFQPEAAAIWLEAAERYGFEPEVGLVSVLGE
jgi:O-acetyl-ADP-ribose deacetylase